MGGKAVWNEKSQTNWIIYALNVYEITVLGSRKIYAKLMEIDMVKLDFTLCM